RRARATYEALLEHLAQMREGQSKSSALRASERDAPGELRRWREEQKTWIALPREVDRWWRDRSEMTLVDAGRGWRIDGKGRERARVAFATLVDDELTFTIEEKNCA